jgi:UDP-N-acetylmuramoyl-L-alanyl-D-glutamate--2,6-diaminopimelate ligase
MLKLLIYKIKRPYHWLKTGVLHGLSAQIKYRFPARKLTVIAITGTDGKTTSSTLLYHVLQAHGLKVALLSTVAAYLGNEEIDTGFHVTSPQPQDLQRFMRMMVDKGYTHLVLEVTSHGIYQYRTWGVEPNYAGLTNIAREHLDYHITYEEYLKAKTELLSQAEVVVLNADDASFHKVKRLLPIEITTKQYSETMEIPKKIFTAIKSRFPEKYNQMNAKLVYTLSTVLGVSNETFITGIQKFPGIPGRMEFVKTNKRFDTVVDYAHTTQGLENS